MSRLFGIFDENLILIIMSWLDLRDHGLFDLALTNVVERKRWMICLSSAHQNSNLRTVQCTHSLLRWLIKRKMQPEFISFTFFSLVDDLSFVGIDNKLLHKLDFSGSEITDIGLLMIAQGCPQLKDITLGGRVKISGTGLLELAANLPGMTSIDLRLTSHMTHLGITAIAKRCPALVKISVLQGCESTSSSVELNKSIRAIARGCPKLQTFSISWCYWLSDASLAFLAERCKELRSVCLHGCDLVTVRAIRAIANSCPDLEKLSIGGRRTYDSHGTSCISQITDESFIIVGQKCSKLVDFSISHHNVADIGIAALARGCPQLRRFYAHDCQSISTDGMMALTHGCKELRTIVLYGCERIKDDSLFRIAEGCLELTSFTIISCQKVSKSGISFIVRGCEKLTSITMKNCRRIDDTALIAIGSSCANLREITMEKHINSTSQEFSDRGLTAIACGCPALESISISYSPNITDASVIVLAQKCLQLKSITLTSSNITDASLIAFATNSRKLQSASIDHCHYITSTGLSILAAECAQMRSMKIKTCKKVEQANLLSLRRKYLRSKTSEHIRPTSVLSMLRYYLSCK
jgi:F-box and leucine-rich repeat protein 2/20